MLFGALLTTASLTAAIVPQPRRAAAMGIAATSGADLSIGETAAPDPVTVGHDIAYSISVANAGPSPAEGVQVADQIPAGAFLSSTSPSQGSCSNNLTFVLCSLGEVASGAGASVTIVVQPQRAGSVTNVVRVRSSTPDPDQANNSASVTTSAVGPSPSPSPSPAPSPKPSKPAPSPAAGGGDSSAPAQNPPRGGVFTGAGGPARPWRPLSFVVAGWMAIAGGTLVLRRSRRS